MPPHFQTPASSRRFLPQSSGTSSVQRNSTPATFGSVFKSSTGSSGAPQSTQGPKFRSANHVLQDDIETSFGDASSSPSPLLTSRPKARSRDADADYIEDVGTDNLDVNATSAVQPGDPAAETGNTLSHPISDRRVRATDLDLVEDDDEEFEKPLPWKRRRLSQPQEDLVSDAASGSSAREDADRDPIPQLDTHRQYDKDGSMSDDSPPSSPLTTLTASRFRDPKSGQNTNPAPRPPRPTFRSNISVQGSGSGSARANVLPETFSPSRRRGKQGYLPGGAAETVRNWVLGLAAAETQHGLQDQDTVRVRNVEIDPTGRCATIQTSEGERWIFVAQPGQRSSRQDLSRLTPGSQVVFKGVGTRWTLDLPSRRPDGSLGAENEEKYNVSVLWEVVEPG